MQEFHEGDLVEAVKGEELHRGRLIVSWFDGKRRLILSGAASVPYIDLAENHGWTLTVIKKATPPLPTESGLYLSSKEGGPWVFELDEQRGWSLLNTDSPFRIGDGHLESNAPFTRLEPTAITARNR